MHKNLLVANEVTNRYSVLISGEVTQLSKNLAVQFSCLQTIQVHSEIGSTSPNQTPLHLSCIYHFVGFGPPSLNQSIYCTSYLHHLLVGAVSQNAKLILVVESTTTHMVQTAIQFVAQFARRYPLRFEVVPVPADNPLPDSLLLLLKKNLHNLTQLPAPSKASPVLVKRLYEKPRRHNIFISWSKIIIRSFVVFVLLLLVYTVSLQVVLGFALSDYAKTDFGSALKLSAVAQKTSWPLIKASGLSPLFSMMFNYPLPLSLAQNMSDLLSQSYLSIREVNQAATNQSFNSQTLMSQLLHARTAFADFQEKLSTVSSLNSSSSSLQSVKITTKEILSYIGKLVYLGNSYQQIIDGSRPINVLALIKENPSMSSDGGIVKSLKLLQIMSGRISVISEKTPQQIAESIDGLIQSPAGFQDIYEKNIWNFSNHNYSPDFHLSARYAAWFVEKSQNWSPDLVFSLSEGDWQKLTNLNTGTPDTMSDLVYLFRQVENRHILISYQSVSDTLLQHINWSGGVAMPICTSHLPCASSVIYPSVTSTSSEVMAPNYHLETVLLPGGGITHSLNFRLSKALGDEYFWVLVSKNISIKKSFTGSVAWPISVSQPDFQSGISLLGFKIPKLDAITEFQLQFEEKSSVSARFTYLLHFLNQPGSTSRLTSTINFPPSWHSTTYYPPVVARAGELSYNTQSSKPLRLSIDFILNN